MEYNMSMTSNFRSKTDGSDAWIPEVGTYTYTSPEGETSTTELSVDSTRYYRSMEGYNTPDFHKRKARGDLLPFTSWSQREVRGEQSGSYAWTADYGASASQDRWNQGLISPRPLDFEARIPTEGPLLVQQAAAGIAAAGYDALTFLGEFAETVRMFKNLSKKFDELATATAKKSKKYKGKGRSRSIFDYLGNQNLETRYGWRTLVYDIVGFQETLEEFEEKRTRYVKKSGLTNREDIVEDPQIVLAGPATFTINRYSRVEVSVRGTVIADILPEKFRFNLATTGWELITLSFVVDWFLTVGKAIDATNFVIASQNYTAAHGSRIEIFNWCEVTDVIPNPGFDATFEYGGWCREVRTVRTPCSVPLIPQITVKLDAFKVFDLIALTVQRLK